MNSEPLEIERKFLIAYPDIPALERMPGCRRAEIIQTYLLPDRGDELRLRQWTEDGKTVYYQTRKRPVSGITRVEIEREITPAEYETMSRRADPAMEPLHKTRYYFTRGPHCFEIDVYPFWEDRAVLEVELRSEDEAIRFPEELTVLREITGEAAYRNTTLARRDRAAGAEKREL